MKIHMTMMVALAIAALACGDRQQQRGDAPDGPSVAARQEPYTPPTASDQPENAADRELVAAIRQQLMADDSLTMAAQNVTIVSEGGNVTLSGRVSTADEKSRIEAAARQASGVRGVDNQIEVAS
jgi:osmotically-inducible protein OsmY